MAVIDQLIVQFSADFKELSRELNKAQGETSRAMRGMEGALKPIGAAFRALGAVAAAAGVALSVDFARRTLDAAGGIGELAEQLGVSTENLQSYQFAAAQAGVESSELEAGLARLTRTLGDAAAGEATAVKAFRNLGVGVLDAQGKIRDTDTVIADIADRLAAIDDPAKRAAVVVDLFGKSGQRLLPLLSQGAAGLEKFRTEAKNAGAVLSSDLIAAADEASDKIAAMETALGKMAQTIVAKAAPAISSIADSIRKAFGGGTLNERIADLQNAFNNPVVTADPKVKKDLDDRLYLLKMQRDLQARIDANPLPKASTGTTSIPQTTEEVEKDRKDFEKREAALSDRLMEIDERKTEAMLANRQAYTDAVIASGIAIADAEKAYRDRMTAEMNAVAEGVQNLAEANAKVAEENARAASDAARELGLTFTSAFEDAVVSGKKLSEVLQGLAQDLIRIMVRKTVTEKLANFGTSLLGNLFNFGKAGGGTISGPTLVGERGPEVFNPGGSGTIVPMSRMGGGASVTYNIDARGADPSVLPRLQAMLDRNKREAVAMAVNTVRSRNAREPAFLGGR
jgi:hypothetical protein